MCAVVGRTDFTYRKGDFTMIDSQKVLNLAVLAGEQLLKSGAEIFRVQETRILTHYGIEEYNVYVISNGIFATVNENRPDRCSSVRHVPLGSVHLGHIDAINQISREITSDSCSIEQAFKKLQNCTKDKTPSWLMILASGAGSGAFGYLFGGSISDSFAAFCLGCMLQVFLDLSGRARMSKFIAFILGAALVTLGSGTAVFFGLPTSFDHVIIGAIIPLVPGTAFTTSIREFFNGDYLSGSIHLIDAFLTAACIATGVGGAIFCLRGIGGFGL